MPYCKQHDTTYSFWEKDCPLCIQYSFQNRVKPLINMCVDHELSSSRNECDQRFLAESIELYKSCGGTLMEAHDFVNFIYERPMIEKAQNIGGVMVKLAALSLAHELDMHQRGDIELGRLLFDNRISLETNGFMRKRQTQDGCDN